MGLSAISVASNIAEGTSRNSQKEQAHFTEITYGSLMELPCQLIIAKEIGHIDNCRLGEFRAKAEEIAKMLTALAKYHKRLNRRITD